MSTQTAPDKASKDLTQVTILTEDDSHTKGIEALYDHAFGPGRFAKTAERLREGNTLLQALSRVGQVDGEIVAAVRLWPLQIGMAGRAVFIGPVAVCDAYRGSGLGLKLTQICMEAAKAEGWELALLIGDFGYFTRIGFRTVPSADYPAPGHIPEGRLMIHEMADGALARVGKGELAVPLPAFTSPSE